MRIDKLQLQDFGQFHDKNISLAPGINLIYGASESGKTTIKDFIVDMLYGIDKEQETSARINHYEKVKPISGAGFSGAMEICVDGEDYRIERNFLQQEKNTYVKDLDESKEVPLQTEHSLLGTLLNTPKNIYENTLCMGHNAMAVEHSLEDALNQHIVSAASVKAGDIDAAHAIEQLEEKKKSFSNSELQKREQELESKLSLDRDFDAELEALKKEKEKAEAQVKSSKEEKLQFTPIKNPATERRAEEARQLQEEQEPAQPLTKREQDIQMLQGMGKKSILDNVFVIWFISLLAIALFVLIAQIVPVNVPAMKMGIIGFGVVLVLMTTMQVLSRRSKLYLLLEELEIEQGFRAAKEGNSDELVAAKNKLSALQLKEQDIIKERGRQEKMLAELNGIKEKMQANDIESEALALAIRTIRDLSEDIYDSYGSVLNAPVSDIVNRITGGRYPEIKVDDQLKILVKQGASFISMDYLSVGTVCQIYFALRLSVADILIKENLPIVIDDIFANYDEQRLKETLSCLSGYLNHQIIIFTINPGIQQIFTDLGIESNYIAL